MRRFLRYLFGALLWVSLSSCAESVLIRTHPDGALVSVNERELGIAPVTFTVKSQDIGSNSTYHFVVKKDGYETAQGFIPVVRAPGRVVGMIFSFGLMRIARGTATFPESYDIGLQPITHVLVDKPTRSLAESLRDLGIARDQGLISDDEYKQKRTQILNQP